MPRPLHLSKKRLQFRVFVPNGPSTYEDLSIMSCHYSDWFAEARQIGFELLHQRKRHSITLVYLNHPCSTVRPTTAIQCCRLPPLLMKLQVVCVTSRLATSAACCIAANSVSESPLRVMNRRADHWLP